MEWHTYALRMTWFGPGGRQVIVPVRRGTPQADWRTALGLLVQWFKRPDPFDTFTRYIASKGLELWGRLLLICSLLSVAVTMALLRFSDQGIHNEVTSVINAMIIVATLLMIIPFVCIPTFTRRWSYVFLVYAEIGVPAGIFLNKNPLVGLLQCSVFGLFGAYIAFFHSSRVQTAHMIFAVIVLLVIGYQVAEYMDPALAVSLGFLIFSSITVVPFTCQFMLSLLGTDAENSELDPLTGLLNRRGLQRAVDERGVAAIPPREASYVVAIVDIDNFKRVNDTLGHEAGDQVLRELAERLRECGGNHALVSRFGGDEFVLVDTVPVGSEEQLTKDFARKLRLDNRDPVVTTSVGIAIASTTRLTLDAEGVLAELFRIADEAMYRAKSSGGDQVLLCHSFGQAATD